MVFKKLQLYNFRNIKEAEIFPHEQMNVIYGENAQGKTNLLEALWCFTGAKSFRGAKDSELIKFENKTAKLVLEFYDDGRIQECIIEISKTRKAILNGVDYGAASKLAGKIYSIVFSPNDISIIKDGPIFRRKFLDTAICQLYPVYISIFKRYTRALDQRNKILKEIKYNPLLEEFILDFEKELAECGTQIIKYRKTFVNDLNKFLPKIYKGLSSGKEKILLEYNFNASENKEEYLEILKQSRKEDILNISTSIGPHRDDLNIEINNVSARSFGSQGQKRSAVLALKLAEAAVINKITGKKPIALLDDVMSELDTSRQNYILNHIKGWQVFLTCCDEENILNIENGKIFKVQNGKISE